jgi:hypothetical protein
MALKLGQWGERAPVLAPLGVIGRVADDGSDALSKISDET